MLENGDYAITRFQNTTIVNILLFFVFKIYEKSWSSGSLSNEWFKPKPKAWDFTQVSSVSDRAFLSAAVTCSHQDRQEQVVEMTVKWDVGTASGDNLQQSHGLASNEYFKILFPSLYF